MESRTVLVHFNLEVPAENTHSADEIADAMEGALEVGREGTEVLDKIKVSVPLAEEI